MVRSANQKELGEAQRLSVFAVCAAEAVEAARARRRDSRVRSAGRDGRSKRLHAWPSCMRKSLPRYASSRSACRSARLGFLVAFQITQTKPAKSTTRIKAVNTKKDVIISTSLAIQRTPRYTPLAPSEPPSGTLALYRGRPLKKVCVRRLNHSFVESGAPSPPRIPRTRSFATTSFS